MGNGLPQTLQQQTLLRAFAHTRTSRIGVTTRPAYTLESMPDSRMLLLPRSEQICHGRDRRVGWWRTFLSATALNK